MAGQRRKCQNVAVENVKMFLSVSVSLSLPVLVSFCLSVSLFTKEVLFLLLLVSSLLSWGQTPLWSGPIRHGDRHLSGQFFSVIVTNTSLVSSFLSL